MLNLEIKGLEDAVVKQEKMQACVLALKSAKRDDRRRLMKDTKPNLKGIVYKQKMNRRSIWHTKKNKPTRALIENHQAEIDLIYANLIKQEAIYPSYNRRLKRQRMNHEKRLLHW